MEQIMFAQLGYRKKKWGMRMNEGDRVSFIDRIVIVPGQMTHLVASLTLNSANSCVMQGTSCTQRKVSMVLFVLPSILLVVVIVVTVVIVVVIPVVFVVAVVEVVVVVVGSSVPSINKLSFVIVGPFSCYWSSACPGVLVSIFNICHVSSSCFQIGSNTISNQLLDGSLSHVDLTGDEDLTDKDGDIGVSLSLGDEIFLEEKESRESNISDSDNIGDGGKIVGRAIITWGGGMVSYVCIYGSSCKGRKNSMSKRYLVKSSEELGEMFFGEAGK
ncbi:hypothetical protein Tco_0523190 [Tanacetum coccineum]